MEVDGQRHAPAALPPGRRTGNNCTGSWVDLRTGLDGNGKSRLTQGLDPRTVQPVANRYIQYSIPVQYSLLEHAAV
jgi:hypothetical protein